MYRQEFWIGFVILAILISKGFLIPVSERIDRSFLDIPVIPRVGSILETEQKRFGTWIRTALDHEQAVLTRRQPSVIPSLIQSHRVPAREEWKRG